MTKKQKNTQKSRTPIRKRILGGLAGIVLGISAIMPSSCNLYQMLSLEKDGNYPGIVVFAYNGEKMSDEKFKERFEELLFDSKIYGPEQQPIQQWLDEQSEKYGKSIKVPLELFPEQVQIPEEFITYGNYSANPIDLAGFSKYLKNAHKEISNYDFLAVIYSDDKEFYSPHTSEENFACPNEKCFTISNYVRNERMFYNHKFTHEFLHLIGASDKQKNDSIKDNDIMKSTSINFDDSIIISEPTAREIGWLN